MVIVIRIILLLLPVVMLIFWLRWRAQKNAEGDIDEGDVRFLRVGLIAFALMLLAFGLSLRFSEDTAVKGGIYVPAHMENGVLIPAHFEAKKPQEAPPERNETEAVDDNDNDNKPS